ncbi:MAG: tetratricopeptide repeat protein [Planctomycetota bacterium]|jgi:tetratricopeptide (TPR) repeat protein
MAMRRLNKKVAFIGSAVVVFLLLAVIAVVLRLGQDPQEYIRDAEAALEIARQATDEQVKEENYKRAVQSFRNAFGRAQTDSLREEVLFKLADVHFKTKTKEWPYILGCWDEIIKINPDNAKARYGKLEYFYILADTGASGAWKEVHEQASAFLKVARDNELLMKDTAELDVSGMEAKAAGRMSLGPYLYLIRGRAALEMAVLGIVTNKDESLEEAVNDLKKVQESEPNNIDAYWYLSRAAVTKGEIFASRGNFEERDKAARQALEILEQAVNAADNNPEAYINLLTQKLTFARSSGSEQLKEQIQTLEAEYLSLVKRFDSSSQTYAAVSQFYTAYSIFSGPRLGSANLDKAIEAVEKAIQLDGQNVAYAIHAANLYYRSYSIYGQKSQIDKAIETANRTLTLPDAQDTPGPRQRAKINNKFILYAFLANCYTDQILEPSEQATAEEAQSWLSGAEQAVHEIEQIFSSAEEPLVVKWKGMLELARGNKQAAVVLLYDAYEQLRAIKPPELPWPNDPEFAQLAYTLAKIFKDTSEVGAVNEFLISALYSGIGQIKPESRLDYVDVVIKYGRWPEAIQNIDVYEEYIGSGDRCRELRIKAYIGAKQFDEAEKELAKRPVDAPETVKLNLVLTQSKMHHIQLAIAQKQRQDDSDRNLQQTRTDEQEPVNAQDNAQRFMKIELDSLKQQEAGLLEKLLSIEPNSVDQVSVINVCRNYKEQGQTNQALRLIDRFLENFPDSPAILVYKQVLSEPDPAKITQQRHQQIEEQVLSGIADPIRRKVQLGIFYRRYNEPEKAIGQFKDALETVAEQEPAPESSDFEQIELAANYLFDIALGTKDWDLAEQVTKIVRGANIDGCRGQDFAARLAAAKGEFKDALVKVNECLKQKPVFSRAYLLRSDINAALGNEHASMEDMRSAASINPLDGTIAKASAIAFYRRNQQLGDKVSTAQVAEVRDALERAIALNPGDLMLFGLYADFIAPTEPVRAVAIRQDLQRANPTIENALLLGKLATEAAVKETNPQNAEALFAIAGSAFEQAKEMNPGDKRMLYYYAEYFRARGQSEDAKKLLAESQEDKLLWDHYYQAGQYEDARRVLEQLYKSGTKDSGVFKGLLLIAEKTSDKEAVKKYSEGLVAVENTVDNNLAQIQAFLRVGLVKEAEYKLQSFKEKYPNEPRMLLLQAWLLMRQGQLDKALEKANENLQSNPDNPTGWRLKGEINFFRGDYNNSISNLRKSKLLLDEPATRISLAKAFIKTERYEDAVTELRNTINAPGVPSEAMLLLEHIYLKLGRKESLKRFYEEALEKYPDSANWLNRAGTYAIKTGEFERAEQLFKRAFLARQELRLAQSNSDDKDVLYSTAFDGYMKALIAGAGTPETPGWNPSKLDKVFEECEEYKDSVLAPIAHLSVARAKMILGDKPAAIQSCRAAVDTAGDDQMLAADILLRMYAIVGAGEATNFCEQKLAADPDSLAANFAMFNIAKITHRYRQALNYISKCIDLAGPDGFRRIDYTLKKGDILILLYEKTSDKNYLKTAISDYESLLAKMPSNTGVTTVLNNLAYLLAENNERLPEALKYAERALNARPNSPIVLDTYAYVLLKNGKKQKAAEFLAAALQHFEQDKIAVPAEVYEHKGMIQEELGAKSEALSAYKQALEAGGEKLSQKVRQRIENAVGRVSP